MLKVYKNTQTKWKDDREAFNGWRQALESLGILVFQTGSIDSPKGVEISEMRGFAISDQPLPVIVVNSKDSLKGRIFSLLHELAHILLGDSGISGRDINEEVEKEVFCNHVAGATLLPSDWFQKDKLLLSYRDNWSDEAVEEVAKRFKVSPEVIWRRLLTLEFVTPRIYKAKRQELLDKSKDKKVKKGGGGPPPSRRIISSIGRPYIELVLSSYYQEKINSRDVSDYLDMKLNHLPKVEDAIFGVSYST